MTITVAEIFADLQTIAERLDVDIDGVHPSAAVYLEDDLGMDSLSMMDFLVFLEKKYGVGVPNEKLQQVVTVGDVVALLNEAGPAGVGPAPVTVPAGAQA
jgi:acyl carrier protein